MYKQSKQNHLTRGRYYRILSCYITVAVLVLMITPFLGSEAVSLKKLIADMTASGSWSIDTTIFVYHRIPRVLLGFMVGGSLAVVGCVFQVILRNSLAAPYTLGVTGSGSVGAVLAITIPQLSMSFGPFSSVQLMGLLGSALAMLFIYAMARRSEGVSMNTLLLSGVTVGILCVALMMLIRYIANPHLLVAMDRWLMGGLDIVGFRDIAALWPLLLPGLGILFMQTKSLNHLSLGDQMAQGYGIDVIAVQRWCFVGGSVTTAAVVSIAGPIAFVG
ncbi:MAG: iron ABC transporter permease, partial [Chloroflexi bacterium]|nr:iron ABC transporter permease [Chloroflexota bacterium]